jgi:hypothetical protein
MRLAGVTLQRDNERRSVHKGFAFAIFERGGLRNLRAEALEARQADDLSDRFNVTAV